MNIFESVNETTGKLSDAGQTYLKKTEEYYILKAFQQLTLSLSLVAKALIIGGLLFITLMFLAVAGAIALGTWLDHVALGYVIVAGVFLIMTIIIYFSRQYISNAIIKIFSLKFFD